MYNLSEIEINVQDYRRGHEHGAADRVIREVTLTYGERVVGVHRFSANWRPRQFAVEPGDCGRDYMLTYVVSDDSERRGALADFIKQ